MNVYLESLGCARNQVDSETMLARLAAAGVQATDDPAAADAIVVNTCSFIESAADESIDAILQLARFKQEGRCRRLIVTGCLPERYREPIVAALSEVDLFLGTGAYDRIVAAVRDERVSHNCLLPDPDTLDTFRPAARVTTAPHAVYLKIAEGCSRRCTYCIIPKLRGRQKSRPRQAILDEARDLIAAGARELTLVAQEATAYGQDLSPSEDLARLLDNLARLDPTVWVRLMYGHPESIGHDTISVLAAHDNICPYLDIPIQHAADGVLRRMGRRYTEADLLRLFEALRLQIPHIALRTTVLVGFPGESERDFEQLKTFVQQVCFDHLGVFAYSDADDLPAHQLQGHVPQRVARNRLDELMLLQRDLSAQQNTRYLGTRQDVLIEERQPDGYWMARTRYQAPEVDGVVFVRPSARCAMVTGQVIPVRICESLDYDLVAEAV
ncbi:MAG: 30S ribosomal protein S12 methylthiotransferase RimO [Desulfatitalea sp.]|nr:30S ribosomal protein S12 methylthiotransferase RimO [Desulfatitalea sp.]NNJ99735.1 30S ribosomal protein S12 methylthiotransferase RimO [Desulfatitalea sp.]